MGDYDLPRAPCPTSLFTPKRDQMNMSYSIAFSRWVVLRRGHKPGSLSHCADKETKVQGDCSSELRMDPDETSSLGDEGYFFRFMVGRRRREGGQEPSGKPRRLGIFKRLCKAVHQRGSHSGRWAPSRPGRIGLAPTRVGVEMPALTSQPACQLGKLN